MQAPIVLPPLPSACPDVLHVSRSGWKAGWRGAAVAGLAPAGLALAGCASIGPATVPADRVDYAEALATSWKDQMLLNIVRLRYADVPTFMDVSSVVSAYALQGQVQAGLSGNIDVPSATVITPGGVGSVSVLGAWVDRPTISYTPLTGQKFAQSLLAPIPPAAIFSLISAGYPADAVILSTVRAINGVWNDTIEGGERRAGDPAFFELVEALRRVQRSRAFSIELKREGGKESAIAIFARRQDPELARDIAFIGSTLGLETRNGEFDLAFGAVQRRPDELAVLSRSMIEIMIDIATMIDVPPEHVASGKTIANSPESALGSRRVRILSGSEPPAESFAQVRYGDTWYWIPATDFASKRALTFLLLFFSLAETGVVPATPVLTIPVQ